MNRRIRFALSLPLLLCGARLHAQAPPAPGTPAAQHRARATEREKKHDYAGAIAEYRAAYPLDKAAHPGDAANDLNSIGLDYFPIRDYGKAIAYLRQALPLFRQVHDQSGAAYALLNMGTAYENLSRSANADDCYRQALLLFRQSRDQTGEAVDLMQMGIACIDTSRYAEAITDLRQALPIFQRMGSADDQANALLNLGNAYGDMSRYAESIDCLQQALPFFQQASDGNGEATALMDLGDTYDDLGQQDQGLADMRQALAVAVADRDPRVQGTALTNIAWSLDRAGRPSEAVGYYRQAIAVDRRAGDVSDQAYAVGDLGVAYHHLGQYKEALRCYGQSLPLIRRIQDRRLEGRILDWQGWDDACLGRYGPAMANMNQGLILNHQVGDGDGEALTLSHLMSAWRKRGQPRVAVFYGKQAVAAYQGIRQGIHGLDTHTQQDYLASVSDTYRALADLLIGQGRLPEAGQVLDMLKRQEQSEYLRGPETLPGVPGQVDLTPPEADAERQYQKIADQVTALGRQQQVLLDAKKQGGTLPPADQAELDDVTRKLATADAHLSLFLGRLATAFGGATTGEKRLQTRLAAINNAGDLQDTLRQLHDQGQDVVVLETLVAPDRFAVIVTTAASQKVEQSPIPAADFNKAVAALQGALRDPRADPTGPARALYRIVFAPVEADLAQAHARTLMWSLDGSLRYVPVAALYDGRQYLVERFDNEVFTLGSQTGLGGDEHRAWNALGLGVTLAHAVSDPATGRALQFPALDNVQGELNGVVRGDGHPGGALPGTLLLDPQFTQQAMTDGLQSQRYNVVHIASHFALHPGDLSASFLLLGDGSPWSLADLSHQRTLFSGVDLLALSACDTASGGTDGDGREVDSLGSVAQRDGAKSVLASLWPVADQSTQVLMQSFYRWHEAHPADSKAEALRQAQLALLHGTAPAPASPTRGTASDAPPPGPPDAPPFTPDPKAPYAHPFYWAPFVLIGNWR